MPHQCLKCGSVFADGSPEILRGCPKCQGTRFFYTEKPISQSERDRLREKANTDMKYLVREMLTGGNIPAATGKGVLNKDEWVKIEIEGSSRSGQGEGEAQVQINKEMMKSIEELLFSQKNPSKKFRVVSKSESAEAGEKKLPKKKVSRPPEPKEKEMDKTAVITIHDEGVYELDIEKLLDKSPLIVQKDGSYLVHLPSAFKRLAKKGSAA